MVLRKYGFPEFRRTDLNLGNFVNSGFHIYLFNILVKIK
jgi:hypothetical protein